MHTSVPTGNLLEQMLFHAGVERLAVKKQIQTRQPDFSDDFINTAFSVDGVYFLAESASALARHIESTSSENGINNDIAHKAIVKTLANTLRLAEFVGMDATYLHDAVCKTYADEEAERKKML